MSPEELQKICAEKTVVSVTVAAKALGIGESEAYEAAKDGRIVTIPMGARIRRVPTVWLRKVCLEDPLRGDAAAQSGR
jgi:hypothetical protein